MRYVDGFVLPVPKRNVAAYRRMARKAGKIWMEHGALQFCEAAGDDLEIKKMVQFPRIAKVKKGETVFFSWIVYKSRRHRDQVNAKVMADKRLKMSMKKKKMPFDWTRMAYGGFKILVDL